MKPIPEPVYPCKHCADEYSWPASDLFWSSEDEAWVCDECWDNGDTEEEKGICLADAIAQAQAEHDAQVIEQAAKYIVPDDCMVSQKLFKYAHQIRQKAQESSNDAI